MEEILMTVLKTVITTSVGILIGFLGNKLKEVKKRETTQCKALKNMLKSNLVNQYYAYYKIGKVPRYVKASWYDMFESYSELGGNSFVRDEIEPKWAKLDIED